MTIDYSKEPHLNPANYQPMQGPQGLQGATGPQGLQGPQGPQGEQGPRGLQGPQGVRGPMGEIGPRGEQGPQGERGNDGRDGATGPMGPMGPRGYTGADGRVSFEDLTEGQIEMLKGPQGPPGPQGPTGATGPTGPQGATGPQGLRGETGSVGPQGRQGEIGPQGPKGDQGARGPQGEPGDSGFIHSDHIGEGSTWSSKAIVEYANHGKVNWVEHSIYQSEVHGTANGFAKDLVVHGKTIINYVNEELFKKPIKTTEGQEVGFSEGRQIYSKQENKPQMKAGTDYTLIYRMTLDRGDVSPNETDKIEIMVHTASSGVTTYSANINEGIIKAHFQTVGEVPTKINVKFYTSEFQDPSLEAMAFTIDNFMILEGDYTQKVTPRYFWDTRGVGDKIPNSPQGEKKRQLIIESRNKNLINMAERIDDMYLRKDMLTHDREVLRWLQGTKGDCVSFLVYCKQKDYTLSVRAKDGMGDRLRMFVAGYSDTPTNGQPAENIYYKEESVNGDYISRKFRTGAETNVLAIYIANLDKVETGFQYSIKEVLEYVQLEEGVHATPYEPYRSLAKTLTIPRPLMTGDTLEWDEDAGVYAIHNKLTPTQWELTDIKEEAFINTYEDMTYMYVKNKIPSVMVAKFPIKIEKDDYYRKEEWGFEGENLLRPDDSTNFLKLPNGLFMQWALVNLNKDGVVTETFLSAKKIIHVQATGYLNDGTQEQQLGDEKNFVVKAKIEGNNTVKLQSNLQANGRQLKAYVMIISDNRRPDQQE